MVDAPQNCAIAPERRRPAPPATVPSTLARYRVKPADLAKSSMAPFNAASSTGSCD